VREYTALTDAEKRWFAIYVHTCDDDPRGSGERPNDGKQYVGQAMHALRDPIECASERAMRTRWRHKCREDGGKTLLAVAVRRFGADRFRHEIVAVVLGQDEANRVEDEWILRLDSLEPRGYNRKRGGQFEMTHEERSDFCKRGWAAVPAEARKAKAAKAMETLGEAGRSRRARIRAERLGHERLREIILKGHMTMGAEGRARLHAKRVANTDFKALARKIIETIGPDGVRRRAQLIWRSKWTKAIAAAEASGDVERANRIRARMDAAVRMWEFPNEKLVQLSESGASIHEIASQIGVPYTAVYHALRKIRGPRGPDGRAEANARRIAHTDFKALSRKAMQTLGPEGLTRRANSIWQARWVKAIAAAEESGNIDEANSIRARMRMQRLPREELARLAKSGASIREIAGQYGVPCYYALRLLREHRS
jgi:hypothetical protein